LNITELFQAKNPNQTSKTNNQDFGETFELSGYSFIWLVNMFMIINGTSSKVNITINIKLTDLVKLNLSTGTCKTVAVVNSKMF